MQQILLHVNGFSATAALLPVGSHLLPAWTLIRAAYEAAVRAIWLTKDKNRPHPGHGDILLKTLSHSGALERFASYDVDTTIHLPEGTEPRTVQAARKQVGVTLRYDSGYTRLAYPNGDVPADTGVCADEIVRIFGTNYIPRRTFRGPVFLSGNGLWVDWRENWALNRAIEKIMMSFEGEHSVFDIAGLVGLDYWMVRDYVEKFRLKGFVTALPIPSEAQTA